jgi:carnitine-CoA ligase
VTPERFTDDELVLPRLVRGVAMREPERPLLRDVQGGRMSVGELHARALQWARALMAAGVEPGDRVVTMLESTAENFALWLGIAWAGATEVPINVDLLGGVLTHQLGVAAPRVVIAHPRAVPHVQAAADVRLLPLEAVEDAPDEPARPYAELRGHDTASVMYTSGTTGPSKGVVMPWAQLHAGMTLTASMIARGPVADKVLYVNGPPNHVQAKGGVAAMAMIGGEVLLRHAFSLSSFWDDVAEHGVTDTSLVGSMASFLMSAPESPTDVETTLSNVLMAPMVPTVDAFNRRYGTRTWTAYNMTELSVPTLLADWEAGDTPSCGPVREGYPYYEIRLVDEHDHEVPDGEVGEMVLRTGVPWTMNAGYLDMPEATAKAWRNGWFHTGDGFRKDERGRYHFVDRLKDTIRRRGENVSSFEVEAEVLAHPAVAEVAAIAVPADDTEDEIKVVVVPQDGAPVDPADLLAFLVGRMPRYMLPRYVQVVDALPKTHTLRVQKGQVSRSTAAADGVWDRTAAPVD